MQFLPNANTKLKLDDLDRGYFKISERNMPESMIFAQINAQHSAMAIEILHFSWITSCSITIVLKKDLLNTYCLSLIATSRHPAMPACLNCQGDLFTRFLIAQNPETPVGERRLRENLHIQTKHAEAASDCTETIMKNAFANLCCYSNVSIIDS